MSFPEYTYVTTLRLDARDQVVLDALVERERVPKNHLFRAGLRLLGEGAEIPSVDPVGRITAPNITIRLDGPDEAILESLQKQSAMGKGALLRASIHALAKKLNVSKRRRRSTAA